MSDTQVQVITGDMIKYLGTGFMGPQDVEVTGGQASTILNFPSGKLTTYMSGETRWMRCFEGEYQPLKAGQQKYYSMEDLLVLAMLIDTSEHNISYSLRCSLADGIRSELAFILDKNPTWDEVRIPLRDRNEEGPLVTASSGRITMTYLPRWDILWYDFMGLFNKA